jgi:hypothetical protein
MKPRNLGVLEQRNGRVVIGGVEYMIVGLFCFVSAAQR